jgi:hypothetical protein
MKFLRLFNIICHHPDRQISIKHEASTSGNCFVATLKTPNITLEVKGDGPYADNALESLETLAIKLFTP